MVISTATISCIYTLYAEAGSSRATSAMDQRNARKYGRPVTSVSSAEPADVSAIIQKKARVEKPDGENHQALCCRSCGSRLANTRDAFLAPSKDARPLPADVKVEPADEMVYRHARRFMNPQQMDFTIVSLSATSHVHVEDSMTPSHSWFPGYSWSIVRCAQCGRHVGWRFTRTDPSLIDAALFAKHGIKDPPTLFWGLALENTVAQRGKVSILSVPPFSHAHN